LSLETGLQAMNLKMTPRVPRVEFDAEVHWNLVNEVVGLAINEQSNEEQRLQASLAFMQAWNYDLRLEPLISHETVAKKSTNMGHAEYAWGGSDFDRDIHCPFATVEEVLQFDPIKCYGEIDKKETTERFNRAYRENCRKYPDVVNSTGTYITLFSGFIAIFGWEMLLTAGGIAPQGLGEVANRYAEWMQQYYDALAECEAEVIYSHDDIVWTSGAVFHPQWYRTYIFPNYKKYYAPLLEAGKKIIFLSDGNYTEFIDDIAATGIHGFFIEPLTDLRYLTETYGQSHVIIGNADTRILLSGSREDIRNEVKRCMDLGKRCPGYFMGVSNMIPPNTPVENALYYNEVYQMLCKR
jgi:hypothetical protein